MRTTTLDPLAEEYYSISPYAWCLDNPVNRIDPDGRIAPLLIAVGKGLISATIDAAAQVSVSMANGSNFKEALSEMDYTSVGASFVTGALTMPGMSSITKAITTVATVATDALVDINADGIQTSEIVGGGKSISNTVIDAVTSIAPDVGVDKLTKNFNKAVTGDLTANSAKTMTKETKAALKKAQSVVNGEAFQTATSSVANYTGGIIGGEANKLTSSQNSGTSSTTNSSSPPSNTTTNAAPYPARVPQRNDYSNIWKNN